jgi:hypothetical protein
MRWCRWSDDPAAARRAIARAADDAASLVAVRSHKAVKPEQAVFKVVP